MGQISRIFVPCQRRARRCCLTRSAKRTAREEQIRVGSAGHVGAVARGRTLTLQERASLKSTSAMLWSLLRMGCALPFTCNAAGSREGTRPRICGFWCKKILQAGLDSKRGPVMIRALCPMCGCCPYWDKTLHVRCGCRGMIWDLEDERFGGAHLGVNG